MRKFEYKYVNPDELVVDKHYKSFMQYLDKSGSNGWELVCVQKDIQGESTLYIFKKDITPKNWFQKLFNL